MDDVERSEDNIGAGPLFSRSASENAEVVAGGAARHDAGLWTVSAKDPATVAADAMTHADPEDMWDDSDGDDLWDLIEDDDPRAGAFPPPPFGQPYRSPLAGREESHGSTDGSGSGRWSGWPTRTNGDGREGTTADPVEGTDIYDMAGSGDLEDRSWGGEDPDDEVLEGSIIDEDPFQAVGYEDVPYEDVPYEDVTAGDRVGTEFDAGADSAHEDGGGSSDTHSDVGGDHGSYESTDAADATDSIYDTVGSLFRSEPVERNRDVIDSPDDLDVDPVEAVTGSSPFSSGTPFGHHETPVGSATRRGFEPGDGPAFAPGASGPSAPPAADRPDEATEVVGQADTPGFLDAIEALDPDDRHRARTVLVVVGALLGGDEKVLGLVVGQMLGHPAALVLTGGRVIVVNDRPWQPVVDQYALDAELEIRGRHDRTVAAIGLGDGDQLSMVDGVRDVDAAIAIVDRVRSMTGQD